LTFAETLLKNVMKKQVLLGWLLAPILSMAQIQITPEFSLNFGGKKFDFLNGAVHGSDGKFVFVGHSNSTTDDIPMNHGSNDAWVLVLEEDGEIFNSFTLNGAGNEFAVTVVENLSGNYLALVMADGTGGGDFPITTGTSNIWLKPFTLDGTILEGFHYGGSGVDAGNDLYKTQSGNFLMVGSTQSTDGTFATSPGGKRAYIVRVNTNGSQIWMKYFEEEIMTTADEFNRVIELSDGKIVAAGTRDPASMGTQVRHPFLSRFSSVGDLVDWSEFQNNGQNVVTALAKTWGDTLWIGGKGTSSYLDFSATAPADNQYAFVYKVNPENLEFDKALFFTGSNAEIVSDITPYGDSLVLVTLVSNSNDGSFTSAISGSDVYVALVNGSMQIKGIFPFGGNGADGNTDSGGMKLFVSGNDAILYGHSNSIEGHLPGNYGEHDGWVLKFNPEPLLSLAAKSEKQIVTMYPNPSSDKLTVLLPFESGTTHLEFFNALGQSVHQVDLSQHINQLNVSHLPAGVYLVTVSNGAYRTTNRIVIQ
jgi:hypothetical protein